MILSDCWGLRPSTDLNIPQLDKYLIPLVTKPFPDLCNMDICGVQPMVGPSGLIFAMKSKYKSDPGKKFSKYRYRILNNIKMMHSPIIPKEIEDCPGHLKRELNIFKQKDCIEFVPR